MGAIQISVHLPLKHAGMTRGIQAVTHSDIIFYYFIPSVERVKTEAKKKKCKWKCKTRSITTLNY